MAALSRAITPSLSPSRSFNTAGRLPRFSGMVPENRGSLPAVLKDLLGDKDGVIARLNAAMIGAVPLNAALGLTVVDFEVGVATVRLPYNLDLVGNPVTGVLHGGAITALMDATCGLAVFLKMETPTRIATLDLRID